MVEPSGTIELGSPWQSSSARLQGWAHFDVAALPGDETVAVHVWKKKQQKLMAYINVFVYFYIPPICIGIYIFFLYICIFIRTYSIFLHQYIYIYIYV